MTKYAWLVLAMACSKAAPDTRCAGNEAVLAHSLEIAANEIEQVERETWLDAVTPTERTQRAKVTLDGIRNALGYWNAGRDSAEWRTASDNAVVRVGEYALAASGGWEMDTARVPLQVQQQVAALESNMHADKACLREVAEADVHALQVATDERTTIRRDIVAAHRAMFARVQRDFDAVKSCR